MLAIVLALASAIGYGGSDFAGGLASRSAGVIQVTLLASAVSAMVVTAALPFAASHPPGAAALAWGAVAGLGGTTGAFALYLGFRHAAFSVAGPISAVGTAGFSVLAGLLLGERPTPLALTGIVLALPAIVGTAASAASGDHGERGFRDRGERGLRRPPRARPPAPRRARPPGPPRDGRSRGLPRAWWRGRVSRCSSSGSTGPARAAACGRSPPRRSPNSRRPSPWPRSRATSGCPVPGRGCWR